MSATVKVFINNDSFDFGLRAKNVVPCFELIQVDINCTSYGNVSDKSKGTLEMVKIKVK